MSTLTALYEQEQERVTSAAAAQAEEVAARYAAKVESGQRKYREFFSKWEPLKDLLGLKGAPTVTADGERVEWAGATMINNHPVVTRTLMHLGLASPNLHVEISAADNSDITARTELSSAWAGTDYPKALGRLCSVWMENYTRHQVEAEEQAAKRQAALADATKWLGLARTYVERRRQWEVKCRRWASEWAVELWQPHELWRVRYVPVGSMLEDPDEDLIQSIVVMETPEDILTALRQFPTATVTKVSTDGQVTEVEIPSFLDAQKIEFSGFSISEPMAYHRRYFVAPGIMLNVPPFEERVPEPAPGFVAWHDFVAECNMSAWIGEFSPDTLVSMTAEQFAARFVYGH